MLLHAQREKSENNRNLVGSSGLEPPTSRLSGVRSNLLSYEPIHLRGASRPRPSLSGGGDERVRTDDPLLAKQVLSQLSYTPVFESCEPSKLNNDYFSSQADLGC